MKYQIQSLLRLEKRQYLLYYWSDKIIKGTVVNRVLSSFHGDSLEIMLTVTLMTGDVKVLYGGWGLLG